MIEIGLLLADSGGELAERFLGLQEKMNVRIHVACNITKDNLDETIDQLIEKYQVEVLISRNPLSYFVKEVAKIPALTLDIAQEDIARAIYRLNKTIHRFAFYFYRSDEEKYSQMKEDLERMTGCEVVLPKLEYDQGYDYNAMDKIFAKELEECEAVVTGTTMVAELFEAHGKYAIPLSAETYRIREVISDAVSNALLHRREKYQLALSEWALDTTKGYFIMIQDGRVVMINDNLCQLLNLNKADILGVEENDFWQMHCLLRKMRQIHFRGIFSHKGIDYITAFRRRKFSVRDNEISVYTLNNIEDVQSAEYKVRRELTKTGFKAKWHFEDIVSENEAMAKVLARARKYARSKANLLIVGESGTGKELMAQSIHNESAFADGPFVAVNCSAIPENLLESELFGYEEGAFTGAKKGGKTGMFELSHGGTLFLDEIGEMPLVMQAKLLRCIQESAVTRVGGTKFIPIQNRLICATNRDLFREVKEGRFRRDLYYRINVLNVSIPPLRERKDDMGELAQVLWARINGSAKKRLPESLIKQLCLHDWPGNIRELEGFIWRLEAVGWDYDMQDEELKMLLEELTAYDDEDMSMQLREEISRQDSDVLCLKRGTMEEMQQAILRETYDECDGNLTEVAKRLNMGYSTVLRKIQKIER